MSFIVPLVLTPPDISFLVPNHQYKHYQ